MSSKLMNMKFMQRASENAVREEEKKVQKRKVDEQSWRLSFKDQPPQPPKLNVKFEASYSAFDRPSGRTSYGGATPVNGSGEKPPIGRMSFGNFNLDVEKLHNPNAGRGSGEISEDPEDQSEDAIAQRKRDEYEREKKILRDMSKMSSISGSGSSKQGTAGKKRRREEVDTPKKRSE
ncbi:hypothetical protein SAICODRAFT_16666 [Saitoella complicata NRRL Y-17804]|uniref:M-phase phosphoprotein 6 n=1 Tax=Saitoella complicata (strain BCRC 22490 / CBS 7301 / JCM 7358 / NBRC 10748 / NRRL Y-17804) TaxID=698492 RepID=A0A0E9N7Y0_SAICN|nr:uncharacterized protein SAICODRAFT_16666 [Saitoella complicata NRRL Y-17804]ODQ55607.1 hypothetical protein SAICODRAFT_16666 [Saitoella complicata NRRL Y-17804]GAO46022.1 hypothetical protein G7K_0267-t1 [Saitoella complicata NRRL Y-17804]